MSANPLIALSRAYFSKNAFITSRLPRIGGVCLYSTAASPSGARNAALKDRLAADLKAAMRAKEKTRLSVVKGLISDLNYAEKSEQPPESLITVVQKAMKRRQDSAEQFRAGGRPELANNEDAEVG